MEMPHSTQATTVLFTDIVGSSKLYQKLGNVRAEEKIRFTLSTLQSCIEKHSGRIIKTIGDEVMSAFDELVHASDAAIEMNLLMQDVDIELRTGISSGTLIERDGDLFGDVVNNAAFLTKTARAKEILIDEMALDKYGTTVFHKIEFIAEMTIKGNAKPCKIFRLNWDNKQSETLSVTIVNQASTSPGIDASMSLKHQNQTYTVNPVKPIFVVGRDKAQVTLSIAHAKISRRHCTISFKTGKFILEDHSTNGTYVNQEGMPLTRVHREAFALIGEGQLLLGQDSAEPSCIIHYKTE